MVVSQLQHQLSSSICDDSGIATSQFLGAVPSGLRVHMEVGKALIQKYDAFSSFAW